MRESSNHFPLWFAANAGSFMSNGGNITAGRNAPLFAWLGPLAGLAELGTEGYPRPARLHMALVNLIAVLIAIFSAIWPARTRSASVCSVGRYSVAIGSSVDSAPCSL